MKFQSYSIRRTLILNLKYNTKNIDNEIEENDEEQVEVSSKFFNRLTKSGKKLRWHFIMCERVNCVRMDGVMKIETKAQMPFPTVTHHYFNDVTKDEVTMPE